jgi:hypothetical protein
MSDPRPALVAALREQLPEGYEIVPIEVLQLLVGAGFAAYDTAIYASGMQPEDVENAAQAGENILRRYYTRHPRGPSHE